MSVMTSRCTLPPNASVTESGPRNRPEHSPGASAEPDAHRSARDSRSPNLRIETHPMMPDPAPFFLTEEEVYELTGRKVRRLQIEQLRRMLIPFHVNALGRPVITRVAVIGGPSAKEEPTSSGWAPRVVKG